MDLLVCLWDDLDRETVSPKGRPPFQDWGERKKDLAEQSVRKDFERLRLEQEEYSERSSSSPLCPTHHHLH